ncbi:MAG: hypothetical protein ACJA1H_000817 [Glaciecola sp.]|jgi:hypothetical protein
MSLGKLIISVAVFIGILMFNKTNTKFLKIILLGYILSFISSFFDENSSIDISYLSFGILTLIYSVYSIYSKKWLSIILALSTLISFIFKTQHWPYMLETQTLMIVPTIAYILALKNYKPYKDEVSIQTILVAYAISEIIRLVNYLIAIN